MTLREQLTAARREIFDLRCALKMQCEMIAAKLEDHEGRITALESRELDAPRRARLLERLCAELAEFHDAIGAPDMPASLRSGLEALRESFDGPRERWTN
jgi:hypothetical protein